MTATVNEWGGPPRRGSSKWAATAYALKERPCEWVGIITPTKEVARSFVSSVRRGYGVFAPKGAFEAVFHNGVVRARYVGNS